MASRLKKIDVRLYVLMGCPTQPFSSCGRPREAARAAKRAWFEFRLRRGQTPTKIAEELGITPQAVREQLRRLGLTW